MDHNKKAYRKYLSSDKLGRQIWGALLKRWWLPVLFLLFFVLTVVSLVLLFGCQSDKCGAWCAWMKVEPWNRILYLLCLTSFVATLIVVCNNLTEINNLLRKENRITWCQIWILIAIGLWIIGFVFILGIQKEQNSYIGFGLLGSILAWIFQDKIKGAVAFVHLRMHHLLNIGDWIQVPGKGVDGEVKRVSLTTVTLYNWDTTTSTIPISTLQSDHFINLQHMSDGKTYGRKMLKAFTLDTGWIRPVTQADVAFFKSDKTDIPRYLPAEEIKEKELNAHLFRVYLYHWLMDNPHISQQPRLLVRWSEPKDNGMVLEVYAFITDTGIAPYEWQQSQIIEHILTAMKWFDLRLYQSPSAYDARHRSIFMTDKPAVNKTTEDQR